MTRRAFLVGLVVAPKVVQELPRAYSLKGFSDDGNLGLLSVRRDGVPVVLRKNMTIDFYLE